MVSWDPIEDCSALNGEITAWTLLYSSPYTAARTLTVPGSNDASGEVVLTGLIFSTEYQIQVAAVNGNGNVGTYSPAVTATTLENGIYKVSKHMFSVLPYSAKFSRFRGSCNLKHFAETIFVDQGNPVSHAFYLHLFVAPNFRGSRPIRKKRENYAPRKFGAYTVLYRRVAVLPVSCFLQLLPM